MFSLMLCSIDNFSLHWLVSSVSLIWLVPYRIVGIDTALGPKNTDPEFKIQNSCMLYYSHILVYTLPKLTMTRKPTSLQRYVSQHLSEETLMLKPFELCEVNQEDQHAPYIQGGPAKIHRLGRLIWQSVVRIYLYQAGASNTGWCTCFTPSPLRPWGHGATTHRGWCQS